MTNNIANALTRQAAVAAQGLTSAKAAARLERFGPNMAKEEHRRPLLLLISKLWAPVPWMLEVTIVLELLLGRTTEAGIIALLLVFNAVLSFVEENRAQNALALLRARLSIQARVLRDGHWQLLRARGLVPGDVVHLRTGDIVPADVRIASGEILVDQAALTGESVPVEAGSGQMAYAGTMVKRGEVTGEVTATGTRTEFGKTAELVRLAKTGSHLERIIFTIVSYLVALDAVLVVAVLLYAALAGMSLGDILPFALILLVASVPVALPATFTVATALGALELARQGVLVTRLSAIEEAAGMEVLCSDKTGTITKNELAVSALHSYAPHTEEDLLRLAAAACDESTQDPIDMAILLACQERQVARQGAERVRFIPFDPATKRSEGYLRQDRVTLRVVKGAPQVICGLTSAAQATMDRDVESLAVLRIHANGPLPAAQLGDSSKMQVGDWVLALGEPFGLQGTVTAGIISATGRSVGITHDGSLLQTDAAINPGNSGGPLVNLNGKVIGISTAISTGNGGFQGVGFAIPINMAKWVNRQLIAHGKVERAYLGVTIQPVTASLAAKFGVKLGEGVLVSQVQPGTPAAKAGLKAGDVIMQIAGHKVTRPEGLREAVEASKIGSTQPLALVRDGKPLTLNVTLLQQPANYGLASSEMRRPGHEKPSRFDKLGVEVSPLTAERAKELGMKASEGVVIRDVQPGSPAAEAGLRAGMVITEVNHKPVKTPEDLQAALSKGALAKGVLLLVHSQQGSRFVVIQSMG